jgi:glycosyltransferase involved in cell wall biosynthesis
MLTGVVIARNEEKNLPLCLPLLKFCSQVLVVDNNSTDNTVTTAQKLKVKVIRCHITGDYAAVRNFALDKVTTKWVLFVDADELVTPQLSAEITEVIKSPEYVGYFIPRKDFMWGSQLHHGDTGKIRLLRLARRDAGKWQGKVHETWQVEHSTGSLKNPLLHYPHPTLKEFLTSINHYSSLRAREIYNAGDSINPAGIFLYPAGKFLYLWLVRLGFLDGTAGFVHAMLMSFYSFLVRGKVYLLSGHITDADTGI